jgi:hypothetical protein
MPPDLIETGYRCFSNRRASYRLSGNVIADGCCSSRLFERLSWFDNSGGRRRADGKQTLSSDGWRRVKRARLDRLHRQWRDRQLTRFKRDPCSCSDRTAAVMVMGRLKLLLTGIAGVVLAKTAGMRGRRGGIRQRRPQHRPADHTHQQNGVKAPHPHAKDYKAKCCVAV